MNILLTGRPGTGKTWVMNELIKHYECTEEGKVGLINYLECGNIVLTGKYTGDIFEGSDKLSMAAISSVGDLIDSLPNSDIVFEGDRFTNSTMLQYDPVVINIAGDGKEGRDKRGSNQTPQRLKSMATRYDSYSFTYRVPSSQRALELVKNLLDGEEKAKDSLQSGVGQASLF